MNLKKREELKDALTDKFKGRFGHGAPKKSIDEMSVASGTTWVRVRQEGLPQAFSIEGRSRPRVLPCPKSRARILRNCPEMNAHGSDFNNDRCVRLGLRVIFLTHAWGG